MQEISIVKQMTIVIKGTASETLVLQSPQALEAKYEVINTQQDIPINVLAKFGLLTSYN